MPGDMHCMPVNTNYTAGDQSARRHALHVCKQQLHSRGSECQETCTACLLAATTQQGIRVPGDMHCMPVNSNYTVGDQSARRHALHVCKQQLHSRGSECQETCTACLLAATTQQGIRVPGDMHCMPVSSIQLHSRGSECQETCNACLLAATTQQGIRVPGDMQCMFVNSNYTAGDQSARRHALHAC